MSLVIGLDASRGRSGGAQAHLVGILNSLNPEKFGAHEIHLWAYKFQKPSKMALFSPFSRFLEVFAISFKNGSNDFD